MNRGEVHWVNFDPQVGSEIQKRRPAVVVSQEPFNTKRRTVVVVPLSTAHTRTEWPLLIATQSTGPAVAVIDQLKAADKARFGPRIGQLTEQEMSEISDALACLLDLP